jgi:hypothetical protein
MTSDRELYAALVGLSRRSPGRPPPLPDRAPAAGPGGGARTRNPAKDGRAPHRQPPTPARREVNAMPRPPLEELQRQVEEDGGCEATDGCWVEPDGYCEHDKPSWLLVLGLV